MNSLYELLRVKPDADREAIKRAFYRLAKEHHPDISKNSALFIKMLNAYKTLTDDYKREVYDSARRERVRSVHKPVLLPKDRLVYAVSLSDIARTPHYRTAGGRRRKQYRPREYDICVNLTAHEQQQGAVIHVDAPAHVICPLCRGHHGSCTLCSDRGYILKAVSVPVSVPRDIGDGEVFAMPLERRRGSGFAYFMTSELLVKVIIFQR
jgi:DnaJ-class molecular chaperone